MQIDTSDYRDASQLVPGTVLVVGCEESRRIVDHILARQAEHFDAAQL
jgi:hypothetical protein